MTRRLPEGEWSIAESLILRAHRRRGIGRAAAMKVFGTAETPWVVEFSDLNNAASGFWRQVVGQQSDGEYIEEKTGDDRPRTSLRFGYRSPRTRVPERERR